MTVVELVEKLSEFPPGYEVRVKSSSWDYPVQDVTLDEDEEEVVLG